MYNTYITQTLLNNTLLSYQTVANMTSYATQVFVSQNYLHLSGGNLTGQLGIISADPSVTTISIGYMGENKLISSLPGYDTHRLTFNLRGYDTFYSQSTYYWGIINMFYWDTYINN